MSVFKHFGRLYSVFGNLNSTSQLRTAFENGNSLAIFRGAVSLVANKFHTSVRNFDLMEFFEDPKNWKMRHIKAGRAWKLDDLRIKSNSDLHKLWYVLLKEKNMLLTMEHEYKDKYRLMPNAERIHKVEESMKNLETVVKERNRAYYQLETGETGERDIVNDHNGFGLPFKRKLREHYVEKQYNEPYKRFLFRRHRMVYDKDVISFLRLYNEKKRKMEFVKQRLRHKHVCGLFRRFENIDEEAIKAEFPDVDIEEAKKDKMSRGPRENLY